MDPVPLCQPAAYIAISDIDLHTYTSSAMAAPRYPTTQYLAGNFVISAGCVLFRKDPATHALEICVLHHTKRNEWLLPKGRKDRGETIEQAALRETFEETGFKCELWPQKMPTRAPEPGVNNLFTTQVVDGLAEPIGVTIRDLGKSDIKVIFWYVAKVKDGVEKVYGTQMESESYESIFVDAKVAAEKLTFENDRDIIRQAVALVTPDVKS